MTLEEAVAAYTLTFGRGVYDNNWQEGEKEFCQALLAQLRVSYHVLNVGDLLSCARSPDLIPQYAKLHKDSPEMRAIDKDFPKPGQPWPSIDVPAPNMRAIGPKAHAVVVANVTRQRRTKP